uniref:Y+L amino acid transporter 2-like n=1 Tax=Saccoglossus kowalevskii TaxID=10224 RepID=A0ABM0MBM6_SACKO|nr:PREDICTED: Y+L amino acid transporter 2-like [Saccoglossus kowalevskii]
MANVAVNSQSPGLSHRNVPAEDQNTNEKEETFRIKKRITLVDGILLITGIVIGSGIFISPKGVLFNTFSVGLALVIWVVCGIFSLIGGLCYAELGTTIPKFGGITIYLYEAFVPFVAFLHLWMMMVIEKPTSVAIIILVFADYILYPVFYECQSQLKRQLLAVAGVPRCGLRYCSNVAIKTRLDFMVISQVKQDLTQHLPGKEDQNLPLAVVYAIIMITCIYLLTNIAYFTVMSSQELLVSNAVAVVVISLIMLQVGDIDTLINYTSFMTWLATGLAVCGMVWLRWKKPDMPRPIKLPLVIPGLFILMSLFLVVVPFYTTPIVSSIGLAITLTGSPIYFLGVLHKKKRFKKISQIMGSITWFWQMCLQVALTDTNTP